MKSLSNNLKRSHERAQIAVVLALLMPVLIGAIAMSADVGVLYFNWQNLQAAADSGALAGAAYLPSNSSQAVSTGNSYATTNGAVAAEITSTTVSADGSSLNI